MLTIYRLEFLVFYLMPGKYNLTYDRNIEG